MGAGSVMNLTQAILRIFFGNCNYHILRIAIKNFFKENFLFFGNCNGYD